MFCRTLPTGYRKSAAIQAVKESKFDSNIRPFALPNFIINAYIVVYMCIV